MRRLNFVSAVVLSLALIGSEASAMNLWGGKHDGGSLDGRHWVRRNSNRVSVTEPSTLYGLGSALALLGGAAWILRRK